MKLSKTIRSLVRQEGKRSISAQTILKLKHSKEFYYLIDTTR